MAVDVTVEAPGSADVGGVVGQAGSRVVPAEVDAVVPEEHPQAVARVVSASRSARRAGAMLTARQRLLKRSESPAEICAAASVGTPIESRSTSDVGTAAVPLATDP